MVHKFRNIAKNIEVKTKVREHHDQMLAVSVNHVQVPEVSRNSQCHNNINIAPIDHKNSIDQLRR